MDLDKDQEFNPERKSQLVAQKKDLQAASEVAQCQKLAISSQQSQGN